MFNDAVSHTNVGATVWVPCKYADADQYVSIMLCDVNTPIDSSGYNDAVLATKISVSSNSTSLTKSHDPIVPLLFVKTLILETSPVAGYNPLTCRYANDWEFSVVTYVGVA